MANVIINNNILNQKLFVYTVYFFILTFLNINYNFIFS